jgi:segregation and condensation protein B
MSDFVINPAMSSILEAALFAAGEALAVERLQQLFPEEERPSIKELKLYLHELVLHYQNRGVQLVEVAGGYRFQVTGEYAAKIKCLWERRPPRYSRAFLETLALIAYRQPITRGEIEDIRGVTISSNIIKLLLEREWVRVIGHRDVPGKPALLGTTKQFLDDFNLKNLTELPSLPAVTDLEKIAEQLNPQIALPIESEREFQITAGEAV